MDTWSDNSSTVLLIDSHGLSHYTSYLALGLSKFRNIILYVYSEEDYNTVVASQQRAAITFNPFQRKVSAKKLKSSCRLERLLKPFRKMKYDIIHIRVLLEALTKMNYDIVHIQGHQPIFFLFIPLLRLKRKRIYWTVHDVNDPRPSSDNIVGKLGIIYVRALTQPSILLRYVDGIIALSKSQEKQLLSRGVYQNRIIAIPHFDYTYLFNVPSHKDGLHLTYKNYVLQFGKITQYKGIDLLIDAAKMAKRRIGSEEQFNILIAGTGNASIYRNLLNEEDQEYIHIYNNWVSNSEIPNLFRNAKFITLPYHKGSQTGIVPLAYTFSKPVIASGISSIAENVEHNKTGFIFEAGNAEQFADYIVELITNNNKCMELGKNAYRKLIQEMSLEKCCNAINDFYMIKNDTPN